MSRKRMIDRREMERFQSENEGKLTDRKTAKIDRGL